MSDNSKEWLELLEEKLPDKELMEKHGKLLGSSTLMKKEFNSPDYTVEEIKKIFDAAGAHIVACKIIKSVKRSGDKIHAWYLEPNDLTQREQLKEAYKLKGKYEPEAHKIDLSNVSDDEIDDKIKNLIAEITGVTEGAT